MTKRLTFENGEVRDADVEEDEDENDTEESDS
jgi:hypothetical protein